MHFIFVNDISCKQVYNIKNEEEIVIVFFRIALGEWYKKAARRRAICEGING